MSDTFSSIYFHYIWGTKNRHPFLRTPLDSRAYAMIRKIAYYEKANVIAIGGAPDHVHILVATKPSENISRLVRCLKSGSSKMIRKKNDMFAWQCGYGVFSVSLSRVDDVKRYIKNQKKHHDVRSFNNEFQELLRRHKVTFDDA